MRAIFIAMLLGACASIQAPDKFTIKGEPGIHTLLAERNIPLQGPMRQGVEMIVYNSTLKEVREACEAEHAAGCSIILGGLCSVFILDPSLIDAKTYARIARHERDHCNGYNHRIVQTETGIITDWFKEPTL